jgi:hypothetical protein
LAFQTVNGRTKIDLSYQRNDVSWRKFCSNLCRLLTTKKRTQNGLDNLKQDGKEIILTQKIVNNFAGNMLEVQMIKLLASVLAHQFSSKTN